MADGPEGWTSEPTNATLPMIRQRESGGKNLPPEANYDYPRSHASGLYQDQPGTWKEWTRASGIGTKYAEAYQAPPAVQTAVNEWALKKYGPNSSSTWAASAPSGGYPTQLAGARPRTPAVGPAGWSSEKPKAVEGPAGWSAQKPSAAPQAPGPQDPSIAARQKVAPPDAIDRGMAVQAELGGGTPTPINEPSIAAHMKQIAPQTWTEMARDPAHPMWQRIGAAVVQEGKNIGSNLTGAFTVFGDVAKGKTTMDDPATQQRVMDAAGWFGMRPLSEGKPVEAAKPAAEAAKPLETSQLNVAVKMPDGTIRTGKPGQLHPDLLSEDEMDHIKMEDQGFVDPQGKFLTRSEGHKISEEANTRALSKQAVPATLQPRSVGAAAVQKGYEAAPPVPTNEFINSTDDSFFRLRGGATADKAQFDNFIKALPPELKDAKLQERMFKFMEGDGHLSLEEQALYDQYVRPLKQEEEDLYGELSKSDPDLVQNFDPAYVHRMVKGKAKEFDPWMGEAGGEAASPVTGYRSRSTGSLKERVYYAMESEKGERKLVAITDHGAVQIDKGQAAPLPRYQGEATKPGDKFTVNGERWQIKQAKTSEIESNTNVRYHKNAMASTIKNIVQLRAVARSLAEIKRLKSTPEWERYTSIKPREGWETVDFPPFRGTYFEPKVANVIRDFWTYKKPALGEKLAAINRFAVGSMFWSPLPHALNAGAHWATARGWDWITPQGLRSSLVDSAKAIREVVTQGPKYQQLLREGSGLIYGSVANEEFYRTILKRLGESVQREPNKWDPIARAMGVGPSDLVRMLYGASSRALWSVSDMMMVQRVLELERKGMGTRAAIAEAEKHIPNYRIPPQVLGSRMFAQALKDPSLTAFSRYHYGQWKSYAHMAKDLAVGTPEEKFKAMGNVFATAMLIGIVWPIINQGIQTLTGDKKTEMGPKGSTTIPVNLYDAWHGKPLEQVIQQSITLAPVPKMLYEGLTNRDWFTGRNIAEPYDIEKHRFGRVGAQLGEQAAQQTISPYGTIAQDEASRQPKGIAGSLAKQGLGLRKPFQPYHGRTAGGGTLAQQAARRHARPHGPIEQLEKQAEKWLHE